MARWLPSLQEAPVRIAELPPVYVDLRDCSAHELFRRSPWSSFPHEPEMGSVLPRLVRPGDVVYDIGANLGLHSALLSHLVGPTGRVVAFEPNSDLKSLKRTINESGNAVLYNLAVSDRNGEASFYVPEDHSMGSLANWQGASKRLRCRQARLDDLMTSERLPLPRFVKCDVEGAELKVFQGARKLLDRVDAPIVLFEANVHASRGFGNPIAAARDFLASLHAARYTFLQITTDGDLAQLENLDPVHSNIVAVPHGRSTAHEKVV